MVQTANLSVTMTTVSEEKFKVHQNKGQKSCISGVAQLICRIPTDKQTEP